MATFGKLLRPRAVALPILFLSRALSINVAASSFVPSSRFSFLTRSTPSITNKYSPTAHTSVRVRKSQAVFMSTGEQQQPTLTHIEKAEMMEILSHVENGTGDVSYVVIDVRGFDEVASTGKLSESVHTLPLPVIASAGAFKLDEETFEEEFQFPKPKPDETLVFTCKAGIRSQQAAQFAAMSGYTKLVNYVGGADDWFGGGRIMW